MIQIKIGWIDHYPEPEPAAAWPGGRHVRVETFLDDGRYAMLIVVIVAPNTLSRVQWEIDNLGGADHHVVERAAVEAVLAS